MSYRINYIAFKNFKFFYGNEEKEETNKLVLDRNNLLVYGENGSGKSSIYWALYTMFQSSIKSEDNEVMKYFNDSPENLRNRFADSADSSGITLCLKDSSGRELIRCISDTVVNTIGDNITRLTLLSSDFINYKYLSKIYDFRNSEALDLFPLFNRDLFPFIDLGEDYVDIDGTTLNNQTHASEWWSYIKNTPDRLPRNTNVVSVSSSEYIKYNSIRSKFCRLLRKYLNGITQKANEYLKDDFMCPFSIGFDFSQLTCEYNKKISTRAKDGLLYEPKIILETTYNHSLLNSSNQKVLKPHTFMNEAKLTAIALAIRLAMLDEKPKGLNSAKILVLDDLLVSLDMSNRDIVLDIILKKAKEYQVLILTHDRYLYNFTKSRIEQRKLDADWIFKEMYCKQILNDDIPKPMIINPQCYLSCAYKHYKEFDFPACANYLRKECERILKYLLPLNLRVREDKTGSFIDSELHTLIANFIKLCKELKIDTSSFEKLMEYKNVVMNPLSHDNIKSPIYKQELLACFKILEKLNKFQTHTFVNVDDSKSSDDRTFVLQIGGIDSLTLWNYKIEATENFYAIADFDRNLHFNNPTLHFIEKESENGEIEPLNKKFKLERGVNVIKHHLKIDKAVDFNYLEQCFFKGIAFKNL